MDSVIDRFGSHRMLSFDRDPDSRGPTVEVAHEALLREWGRLRGWIDGAREDVIMRRRLEAEAGEWERAGRDPSFLLRGSRLGQFEAWSEASGLALTSDERDYLNESVTAREAETAEEQQRQAKERALERRSIRRLRALVAAMAIAAVIAVALSAVALGQRGRAEERGRLATARELATASQANLEVDPERSVLLALAAARTTQAGRRGDPGGDLRAAQRGRTQTARCSGSTARSGPAPMAASSATFGRSTAGRADHARCRNAAAAGDAARAVAGRCPVQPRQPPADGRDGERHAAVLGYPQPGRRCPRSSSTGTFRWAEPHGAPICERCRWSETTESSPWSTRAPAVKCSGSLMPMRVPDTSIRRLQPRRHTSRRDHELRRVRGAHLGRAQRSPGRRTWPSTARASALHSVPMAAGSPPPATPAAPMSGTPTPDRHLLALVGHTGFVWYVAYSADGQRIATAGNDGTARIWDANDGQQLMVLHGHAGDVYGVHFSPSGRWLQTYGADGTGRIWDVSPGGSRELLTLEWRCEASRRSSSAGDGRRLLSDRSSTELRAMWDSATGQELVAAWAGGGGAAFSPDGRHFATGGWPAVWDAGSGRLVRDMALRHTDSNWTSNIAYSSDGSLIAGGAGNTTPQLGHRGGLGRRSGRRIGDAGRAAGQVRRGAPAWSSAPTTALVAGITEAGRLHVWRLAGGRESAHAQGRQRRRQRRLVQPGRPALWRRPDRPASVSGTSRTDSRGRDCQGRPTSRRCSSARMGRCLRLAVRTRPCASGMSDTNRTILTLTGHSATINSVAFSPDGTRVASGGDDGTVRVYSLDTDQLIGLAEARVTR